MREFNLDHLRTLLAVADLGAFASAATALNLAQPTISLHLKELESRLGMRLLERGRRGVTATPAGLILIDYARQLLGLADQALAALQHHREGVAAVVRVGASAGLIAHHMPTLLQGIGARQPDIKIELTVTTTAMALEQLLSGQLDLALVGAAARHPGLTLTRWRSDPIMACLPASWTPPRRITPQWLHQQPLLMNEPGSALHHQTMQWFARAGLFPRPKIALNNGEALKSLVVAGYGAALLPFEDGTDMGSMQVRPISPAMVRHTFLAYRKSPDVTPALKRVIALLLSDKRV